MKKYIGCKLVEAEPMNRGDYNKYRGWTIPANEDPMEEGYLLKYPDGYISWSPKKQFDDAYREYYVDELPATAVLMFSADYKERFRAEYHQVKIRYEKLKWMLSEWDRRILTFNPVCPRSTYEMQKNAMADYIAVLEARAVMEGVDLNATENNGMQSVQSRDVMRPV